MASIRIKLSAPIPYSDVNLAQFLGNPDNICRECKFSVNSKVEEADYWFVADDLQHSHETCMVDPEKVFFITGEVLYPPGYYEASARKAFLDQFARIFSCHDIFRENTVYCLPFAIWMINAGIHADQFKEDKRDVTFFRQLTSLPKDKTLSVFCSSKREHPDHNLRFRFVSKLQEHFKDKMDWFGAGVAPLSPKWEGIAPYRYHLALENQSSHNVITEKLYDAFLGLAYPLYYGAPNVSDYFPRDSLTQICIRDLKGSIQKIEEAIESNFFEQRFNAIVEAKNTVCNELNVFERLAAIAERNERICKGDHKVRLCLERISSPKAKLSKRRLVTFTGKCFRKVGSILVDYGSKE